MTKNEKLITHLKELIAILETNVVVTDFKLAQGLGDPVEVTLDGQTWSHIYKIEIEMHKALKAGG